MDTSDLQIVFDSDGVCNHCTNFLEIRAAYRPDETTAANRLNLLIERIKRVGRGKTYDCVIGVSGGVDSSYAAYFLRDAGLRPLAVHMDNGWDSQEAVSNVRKLMTQLKIDYQSYVLDWEGFRDLQLAFLKASVPEAETPTDIAIPTALHHFASKHNIKYIISAGNIATEGILPKSWHYDAKDMTYFRHIQSTFGTRGLKTFPMFDYKKEAYYKLVKRIKIVYPINYVNFDQGEVTNFLSDTFGFKSPGEKHYESRYTRFIQSYYLYEKFGIDYRRARFSSEICSGLTDKETALAKLETRPYQLDEVDVEKRYIAKKLHISYDELEDIIALPAKWYWDYPNNERKLQLIYRIYRAIVKKDS